MASCTVNYNLKDAGYVNFANQTLTFTLLTAGAEGAGDYIVAASSVTSTSDTNGDGSVTLFVNDDSGIKSIYEVTLPNSEHIKFIIPTGTSTIELANLIVNNQPVGDSESQQSSVYAQAIQRANHTGNLTLDSLPGGAITGTLAVANGGTNASSASAARTSLGAQEQKDVLDDLGALSAPASDGQFIVATGAGAFQYETAATARTSLGLGTIATQASSSVDIDGGAIDGAIIGANSAAAGTFTSIDVSDGNITNAGDINCDEVSVDNAAAGLNVNFNGNTGTNKISLADNLASALDVTEGSNSYLKFVTTDSSEKVEVSKDMTGTSILASTTLGYTTGNGGTVTQLTSINTAVTLNKTSGTITLVQHSFAQGQVDSFTLNNTTISATDVIILSLQDGSEELTVTATDVANNSCQITLKNGTNTPANSLTVKINFAVIKAVNS